MLDLNTIWFLLISILFTGFFFLEGFDFGVGILLPFVGKNDKERRMVINTIGPFWDGNEVWLLTAGGAIFAAFPNWYATLFSGFYLALFLILVAMIIRGVAFEFRSKVEDQRWRTAWDYGIFFGSFVPALLWGVAVGNLVRGVAIDETMTYTGTFFDLLNPYSLVGGIVTLTLFTLHGALFLQLKSDGVIRERANAVARLVWLPATLIAVVFVGLSFIETDIFESPNITTVIGVLGAVAGFIATGYMLFIKKHELGAFAGTGLTILFVVMMVFGGLYPRVMPSSLGAEYDLTIHNASSSDYTLQIMTVIALTFVPIILAYQTWTYWVFRKRVTEETHLEY